MTLDAFRAAIVASALNSARALAGRRRSADETRLTAARTAAARVAERASPLLPLPTRLIVSLTVACDCSSGDETSVRGSPRKSATPAPSSATVLDDRPVALAPEEDGGESTMLSNADTVMVAFWRGARGAMGRWWRRLVSFIFAWCSLSSPLLSSLSLTADDHGQGSADGVALGELLATTGGGERDCEVDGDCAQDSLDAVRRRPG
jgi:hypothetical protein